MASGDFHSVSQTMKDISESFTSDLPTSNISTIEENIVALDRYNGWLQNLQQMQNGIKSSMQPEASQIEDREVLTSKVVALQEELLTESMKQGVKDLALRSAQLSSRLRELLFPEPESEDKGKTEWARGLCDKQRTLASDILAHHEANQALQDELDLKKKKIRDIQASNVELTRRLEGMESKQKMGSSTKIVQQQQEKFDKLVSHISMERGILQGLVIGSGVNWAKDEALKDIVIGLGKPLDVD